MVFAGIIAVLLFLALVIGDWFHFTTLKPWAARYGCPLARRQDVLLGNPSTLFPSGFQGSSLLALPHGVARWIQDQHIMVIRPTYRLFSLRFRTAWPLKGTIDFHTEGERLVFRLSKRIPWSSATLTGIWLAFVIGGTVVFVAMYAMDGGFSTAGGVFWAIGMIALGLLVLAGGVILLAFSYRLEDSRLMQVYDELVEALKNSDEASPD